MSIAAVPAALVQAQSSPIEFSQLSDPEQAALRQGEILVTGEVAHFEGRMLVTAAPTVVWNVLTDYANFSKFIPNVVSSEILESNGNQKTIEQTSIRQVFVVTVRSRIRSALTETPQQQIDFKMIEGDLESLQGRWTMEPISTSSLSSPQVLITYTADAEPPPGPFEDAFPEIYRRSLRETLTGIRTEIKRRSQ